MKRKTTITSDVRSVRIDLPLYEKYYDCHWEIFFSIPSSGNPAAFSTRETRIYRVIDCIVDTIIANINEILPNCRLLSRFEELSIGFDYLKKNAFSFQFRSILREKKNIFFSQMFTLLWIFLLLFDRLEMLEKVIQPRDSPLYYLTNSPI